MRRLKPHPEIVNLALLNLATESQRHPTGHAMRVRQFELERCVAEIRATAERDKKRRRRMVRLVVSVLGLLAAFGWGLTAGWLRLPQAAAIALGMVAYTMFVAEWLSD